LSVLVQVLEELVPGQVLAAPHHGGEAPVAHVDGVRLAALAAELEPHPRPFHGDVTAPQRGEAVRPVLAGVLHVAHADQAGLEQTDDAASTFSRGARAFEIFPHPLADGGQRPAELQHAVELGLVTHRTPARVVAILLSPTRVAPHRLDVTVRDGADPHLGPRGGNGETPDAPERQEVTHGLAIQARVTERAAMAEALYARA
jgi:hypothetical protein